MRIFYKVHLTIFFSELDTQVRYLHKKNIADAEQVFEIGEQVRLTSVTEQSIIDKQTQLSAAMESVE